MARLEQHGQDVVALGVLGPALGDQLEQELVGLRAKAGEASEGRQRAEVALHEREQSHRSHAQLEDVGELGAQGLESRPWVEPEDGLWSWRSRPTRSRRTIRTATQMARAPARRRERAPGLNAFEADATAQLSVGLPVTQHRGRDSSPASGAAGAGTAQIVWEISAHAPRLPCASRGTPFGLARPGDIRRARTSGGSCPPARAPIGSLSAASV